MKSARVAERLAWQIGSAMLIMIVGLAFVTSFEAISSFAAKTGAVRPALAWAIPLIIDCATVMASVLWLVRSFQGERAGRVLVVVGLSAVTSTGFNLAHSPHHIGAWCIALVPPAALVLCVELGLTELRRAVRRQEALFLGPGASGGAGAAIRSSGVNLGPLLTALESASATGEVTGGTLSRALAAQGHEISERDARRILAVMRDQDAGLELVAD